MSEAKFNFSEFSEDDERHGRAQEAKTLLGCIDKVWDAYQSRKSPLYGFPPERFSYLKDLHEESFVLCWKKNFLDDLKLSKESERPEETNQILSAQVKMNPDVSTLQAEHLSFDNLSNELSQSVTKGLENQSSSVKIIQRATGPEDLIKHFTPVSAIISDVSQNVSTSGSMQSTSVKLNRNAEGPESLPRKHLLLGHEKINNAGTLNLESHTPIIYQTVVDSHKHKDTVILDVSTKIGRERVRTIAQDLEAVGEPEADKGKPDEAVNMSCMFSEKIKQNPNPYKEVRVYSVPTTDCRFNTRSRAKAKASDNQKLSCSTQESLEIFHTSMSKIKEFSLEKEVKISSNYAMKSEKSSSSHNQAGMLVNPFQNNKMNSIPNQEIHMIKSFEKKWESPSPSKDAVQCKSMSRVTHSSRTAEIETDISCVSTENPNPTISPFSLTNLKSGKATTDKIDQEKFLKDTTFCGNESNPRTSKDICRTAKSTVTCSPPVAENKSSSNRDAFIDNEKDHLSNEFDTFPPKNCPSETMTSPGFEKVDSKMLVYCITQFKKLLSMRENCFEHIYNSLCNLKNSLHFLCHHMQTMVYFFHQISILNGDYVSEKLQMYIFDAMCIASLPVIQLGALRRDVLRDIQYWIINLQRIGKIKSHYLPLESNGKPLVSFETLQDYEKHLKPIWIFLDNSIDRAEKARLYFLTTEKDLMKFINRFIKCLVMVGILKP